jgi:hypothetical protein
MSGHMELAAGITIFLLALFLMAAILEVRLANGAREMWRNMYQKESVACDHDRSEFRRKCKLFDTRARFWRNIAHERLAEIDALKAKVEFWEGLSKAAQADLSKMAAKTESKLAKGRRVKR